MILTPSGDIEQQARIYRDQGKGSTSANHHVLHGYAWRMSEQAAVTGLVHLRRLAEFIEHRRSVAARYDAALAALDGLESARRAGRLPDQLLQVHRASCPPARTGPDSGRSSPRITRCGSRARSTTCRCTGSRSSPSSPARRCRLPRTCVPGTYACRFTPI